MELTITQSGALYAMQHRATTEDRDARKKRVIANKVIPADEPFPESLADRAIQMEEICFT